MEGQTEDTSNALVLPQSGVVVDLTNEKEIALAYRDMKELEGKLRSILRVLREAMGQRSKELYKKTIHIDGVGKVEVKNASETVWDEQGLMQALRKHDVPEDIIGEIVVETVTYKVDAARAKQAAGANPEIAKIIEEHRRTVEKMPTITIS